ncbi:MAG: PQQ-binding-like beta-propeller repeat protein [Ignavibacteriae bacterium]|nr:PQQ-binding-like beta-propeller repeat protein [Ignavibacteriota bacterium]
MRRPSVMSRSSFVAIVFALASMSGCSGLKLPQVLRIDEDDWPAFGKNQERTNATSERLVPPLSLAWECDISSGMGFGSPIVIDSTVIVTNMRGEMYGLNANTGKRYGWVNLGEAVHGSPVIDQNVAYVAVSNSRYSLVAYDLVEGAALWKQSYGDVEVTPTFSNNKLFFGNTSGIFFCVDRTTGLQEWRFRLPDNSKGKGIHSSAAASDSLIIFGADDGNIYALDTRYSTPRWTFTTGAPVFASPAISEGTVFCGNIDGVLFALDLMTGKEQWRFDAKTSIYATPSFSGGRLLIGTVGRTLYCLNKDRGTAIWSTDLNGVVNSSAAISGNIAYIGTLKKELLALKIDDGSMIWKQALRGRVKTTPAIAHGKLYVATDDRMILAFRESSISESVREKGR